MNTISQGPNNGLSVQAHNTGILASPGAEPGTAGTRAIGTSRPPRWHREAELLRLVTALVRERALLRAAANPGLDATPAPTEAPDVTDPLDRGVFHCDQLASWSFAPRVTSDDLVQALDAAAQEVAACTAQVHDAYGLDEADLEDGQDIADLMTTAEHPHWPNHPTRDGTWCRWSGAGYKRGPRSCPDGCPSSLRSPFTE